VIPRRLPGSGEDDCARLLPGEGEDDCTRRLIDGSARSATNPRDTEDAVPAESGVFPPVSGTTPDPSGVGEVNAAEAAVETRVVNAFRLIVGAAIVAAAGVAVSMAVDGMFFLMFGMVRPAVSTVVAGEGIEGIGDPVRDGDDVGDILPAPTSVARPRICSTTAFPIGSLRFNIRLPRVAPSASLAASL